MWNVSTWVQGALRPVESKDFKKQDDAERYAAIQREQIRKRGWTHRVSVTPVLVQA